MVSIITSLYKSDKYLETYSRNLRKFAGDLKRANVVFEIIVIANDASAKEKELEKQFKGQPWFSFISVARESLYASWNRGIAASKGQSVGFWNVDDIRFAAAVVEAEGLFAKGADLVHFPFIIKRYVKLGPWYIPLPSQKIDRQIIEFSPETSAEFKNSMFCGPSFMFTKNFYKQVGPFDEQFLIAGDFDWCARAAYKTDKFVRAKSMGGIFRIDGRGLSAGSNPRRAAENNIIYLRNHTWEKIVVAEDLIIKQYRLKHLLFAGNFLELSQTQNSSWVWP